ncbi:hypothetical protein [Desulfovibrio litoralis]|uniref:Uncharacterized protein n=1 Tax=Desulfovibrio litoralis DSM 11393 TaxID=1121455 RepID=A0A1M7TFY2_9BACT|nr:hypothetical protein [Desulfovibrio litoralis]SHN69615.1 hypothetical protein SAMN02745728_01969 [Desulfovibrio litoralis DSM 11393]
MCGFSRGISLNLLTICISILYIVLLCGNAQAQTGQLKLMQSGTMDEAISLISEDPEKAEELLKKDDSPTALCYRAYLRESGMIEAKGKEDSAEALLLLAQSKLPPNLQAQATEKTEWSGASETLGRILTTLFVLHVNNINTQV